MFSSLFCILSVKSKKKLIILNKKKAHDDYYIKLSHYLETKNEESLNI